MNSLREFNILQRSVHADWDNFSVWVFFAKLFNLSENPSGFFQRSTVRDDDQRVRPKQSFMQRAVELVARRSLVIAEEDCEILFSEASRQV
jgi:hypothetical protein